MMYKLTLDLSGDLTDALGEVYVDAGPVTVELVSPTGPSGYPIVEVTGTAPRLLDWLLSEYTAGNLDEALEILGPNGNAARTEV